MKKILPYFMPLRSLLFIAIFVTASFITKKPLAEISNIWSIIASILNVLTVTILFILTKNDGGFAGLINYEKGKTHARHVFAMIGFIFLAGIGGMILAGFICYGKFPYVPSLMIAPIPVSLAAANLIVLPVSTAFAEDGVYLGCGVNTIKNRYIAVIVPSFFFALQHCFIPTLPDTRYMIYRFLSFLPSTITLCIIYRRYRNPLPIMIGHGVIDFFTSAQILATSAIPGFYEMMTG